MTFTAGQIVHVTRLIWLLLCVIWIGASLYSKRPAQQVPLATRLDHIGPLAVGLYLLFAPLPFRALTYQVFLVTRAVAAAGFCVVAGGVSLSIWARFVLRDDWSAMAEIKEDHALALRGPYRFVRHPIYAGFLIALMGSALQSGRAASIVGVAICFWGLYQKVKVEERLMVDRFGERYQQYQREVNGLLPFLW